MTTETSTTPTNTPSGAPLLTIAESAERLNGYDEQNIERLFKLPAIQYDEDTPALQGGQFLRALLFANLMRSGKPEQVAFKEAMSLTTRELNDGTRFAPPTEPEVNEREPETEAGKDDLA